MTESLEHFFAERLSEVDSQSRGLVAAVAGLLAGVALADSNFDEAEEQKIRLELGRIAILTPDMVVAITDFLRRDGGKQAIASEHTWARTIKEGLEREGRIDVLDALLSIAVADGVLTLSETTYLRRITENIGLSQQDYNALQAAHTDKLSVIEGQDE